MRRLLALLLLTCGCDRRGADPAPAALAAPIDPPVASSGANAGGKLDARGAPAGSPAAPGALAAPAGSAAPAAPPVRPPLPAACDGSGAEMILASPRQPWAGAPLRVVAAADDAAAAELVLVGADGGVVAADAGRRGGPPWWFSLEPRAVSEGNYTAFLLGPGGAIACRKIAVEATAPAPEPRAWGGEWAVQSPWTRGHEALFSAWIERLFDGPADARLSWKALHEVLRDPARNFLHDHLGEREDDPPDAPALSPDCADLPYTLRAYFAFKLGLPFGFSSCSKGGWSAPPRCSGFRSHLSFGLKPRRTRAAAFGDFIRVTVANGVHSGSARAPATADDGSDFYPVPLTRAALRPGTLFADPYGHVLMVTGTTPQRGDQGGVLMAVDGQPDGTVGRKRFWRGNFLFDLDPALGSPGFKRFRPIVDEGGSSRLMTNDEIRRSPERGDYSLEQYEHGVEGFYDRVEDALSPLPRSPEVALLDTLAALEEQVRARIVSVENGRKFLETGVTAEMPKGAAIFDTQGPWEDFSTPSRDLRLLIAIDVALGIPAQVARRPDRYAIPPGKRPEEARAELDGVLSRELSSRTISYTRSDGSAFSLTLADVVARRESLEAAYNPNDCVEHRWGAESGGAEASTCRRRAEPKQQRQMAQTRRWFRERKRPPRE
jgi:hypothetical protein